MQSRDRSQRRIPIRYREGASLRSSPLAIRLQYDDPRRCGQINGMERSELFSVCPHAHEQLAVRKRTDRGMAHVCPSAWGGPSARSLLPAGLFVSLQEPPGKRLRPDGPPHVLESPCVTPGYLAYRGGPKPCFKSCSTLRTPGTNVITNSAGKMNSTIGNNILIPAFATAASERKRRRWRSESA